MRGGRLRRMVTETDEDTGRETENTQQCQAAAAADIDTGRCQRDEVRWKEIGGEAEAERDKINTCRGREGGKDPTPVGSTGRNSNTLRPGRVGTDLDSNNTGPAWLKDSGAEARGKDTHESPRRNTLLSGVGGGVYRKPNQGMRTLRICKPRCFQVHPTKTALSCSSS